MSVDRERTAPVELADVDAGDGRPSHGTDRAAVPDRRPSGARRWWVLGLLLVLGAGLAGGSGLSAAADRRDDDDVARLAPEPGFTASLREPLVERWRTTDRVVGVGAGVVLLADRSGGTGTAPALQAREAATGRVRWTAGWTPRAGVTRCEEAGAALLCDVPGAGFGAPNTDELLGEVPGRLLVVDPVDGRVEAEWDLDGRTVGWAVAGADVVVARREGDRLAVARYALEPATDRVAPTDGGPGADGEPGAQGEPGEAGAAGTTLPQRARWAVDLPLPPGVTANQMALRAERGLVVVEGRATAVLDAADGAVVVPLRAAPEAGRPARVVVSTVGAVVWDGAGEGTWSDRAGASRVRLAGEPVEELADDGSAPEVVLLDRAGRLTAVEVPGGAVLWERPVRPWRTVARVAGGLVVLEPGVLVQVDARTGEESWVRPVTAGDAGGEPPAGSLLLDARRVLLGDVLGGPSVVRLADGVQLWAAVPGPAGTLREGTGDVAVAAEGRGATSFWAVEPP